MGFVARAALVALLLFHCPFRHVCPRLSVVLHCTALFRCRFCHCTSAVQQALFGFNPGVTVLIEFDHVDKRPTKPATPGDKRASENLPIFEGSEVCLHTLTVMQQ